MKQSWKDGKSLYCLLSTLIITNWSGDYLKDTIGNSPFNISDTIYLDYFTKEEFNDLWSQYEKQENITINNKIKDYIFEISEGAPGIVSILGSFYNIKKNIKGKHLLIDEWLLEVNSLEFWNYIESYKNFSKMSDVINDPETMKILLLYIGEGKLENMTTIDLVKNNLIKSNIWKMKNGKISFASRFIKLYIDIKSRQIVTEPQTLPLKTILSEDGNGISRIDIPELVKIVAKYMNRSIIISGQKKTNYTKQGKKSVKGPKEIVYVNQFNDTIKLIFPSFNIK